MDIDKTVAQALILIETINKDYECCAKRTTVMIACLERGSFTH